MARFMYLVVLLTSASYAQQTTPEADLARLCPSATNSAAWASYTNCGSSLLTAVMGSGPCMTSFAASCNCDLYKGIATKCLPAICASTAVDSFLTSTVSGLCAYTTAPGGAFPSVTSSAGPTSTAGATTANAATTTPSKGAGLPVAGVPITGGLLAGFLGAVVGLL